MSLFSFNAFRTLAMVVTALMLPVSAMAQSAPSEETRSLRLWLSAFGGYESDITGTGATPETTPSAPYVGTRAALAYQIRSNKLEFSARSGADSRHYRADQSIEAVSYDGNIAFAADLTPRLKVGASVNAAYSPRFQFSLLPIAGDISPDIAPPLLDYGVTAEKTLNYAMGANATLKVSRRSSFNASVSRGVYSLLDNNSAMHTRMFGGGYSYSATRHTTLRIGYGESTSQYPLVTGSRPRRYTQRIYDVGVNYSRPLSMSRRTTFSFGTGSGAIDDGQQTLYKVTGNAALTHQIRRSWNTSIVYARGLGIVGGFGEPFFADSVSANLQGHLTRKLMTLTTVGFSNGYIGLASSADDYASFQASTRLEMVFKNDRIGVYGNYFYYGYRFDGATSSLVPIPRRMNRNGVRVGLAFRFPLLHERTSRVTR
jgi:hypothetical protein